METDNTGRYRTFTRESELNAAGPAKIWVLGDEDAATLDDGYFLVTMNNSRPFASFPGARHNRGYGVNFGDGHVESIRLRDARTSADWQAYDNNVDWLRLKEITTVK